LFLLPYFQEKETKKTIMEDNKTISIPLPLF